MFRGGKKKGLNPGPGVQVALRPLLGHWPKGAPSWGQCRLAPCFDSLL